MKVLIAEDDAVARILLQRYLEKSGFEVLVASDGLQAGTALGAPDAPRLAVLDWEMPGKAGTEVCQEARRRVAQPYVYIILLTAKSDKTEVIEGLEAGADDYLTKPFHPQELLARLRTGQRILTLEDNLTAARDILTFQATHDALTGLWNRAAILDTLQRELVRTRREHRPLGVLLADLDHFKAVNDGHGHLVGDEVLRETARRLLHALREYDAVGRYGGEEFLILLFGCGAEPARERAQHLRHVLSRAPVQTTEGEMRVTLSVGGICCETVEPVEPTAVLRAADAALYRAKAAGRNRVEMATPDEVGAFATQDFDPQLASKGPAE